MTLKEKMFEYYRENPKASYEELVENTGIPYGTARAYMHKAKQKGELKELEDGSIEVVKDPPVERSLSKKEIITELIGIYMDDLYIVTPTERIELGKLIIKLVDKL